MAHITHVWIPVKDIDNAVKFYTEKLGLTKESEQEISPYKMALLSSSDKQTSIMLVVYPKESPNQQITVGWTVNDLEATRNEFMKKGVVFVGDIVETPLLKIAHFQDSDHHVIQLVELKK